ncbi:MAG: amidase [Acidobacteria bacterium]|nr:amidase [Acidobacteriota bacterium]
MRNGLDRKVLSREELLSSHSKQMLRLGHQLNAYTQVFDPPIARDSAGGSLAGIPVSIKDSLDVAGMATVCGHRARLSSRANKNALCVDRLLDAGAVLLGKTNTPEVLMNWETFNDVYGVTWNPWDLQRTPGGSSGGESSAIAACMSAGGIGSDGGGSIRLPAGLTGICGLKPTPGRVPATGHFPSVGHPGGLLGVIGPMARTVDDVAILFEVVSGHADSDPFSVPFQPSPFSRKIKVGFVEHPDVSVALAFVQGETGLFPRQAWQRLYDVWRFFFLRLNAHPIGFPTPHTAEFLDLAPPTAAELLEMLAARDSLRSRFLMAMDEYPILLMPNPGFGAWQSSEFPGVESMAPLTVANLLGLPALALPVGFDINGMPLSIQAIAKPWQEEMLLDFGKKLEEVRGSFPLAPLARNI